MSATNVIIYPHAAVLITDTKATTEGGIQWNAPKVRTLPWAKLAFSVRGYHAALGVFERLISMNATNYAQAITFVAENFEAILAAEYEDRAEAHAMRNDLDLYVVGWSDSGPSGFWISSYQAERKVQGIRDCHIAPMVDRDAQRRFAVDIKAGIPRLMVDQGLQHVGVGGWGIATEIRENTMQQYPIGPLCGLSSVGSRMQPVEEADAIAAIGAANAERAERVAGLVEAG